MLGQQPLLFLFYECCLGNGLLPLSLLLFLLQGPLLLVNCELVLPKPLNFTLMLQLSHPPSLGIHLLQALILCEFFHQLSLELVFHALLLGSSFLFESVLVFPGGLQLLSDLHALFCLCTLLGESSLFGLVDVEFVSEVFLEFCS